MKGIYLILLMFSLSLSAQSLEEKLAEDLCICLRDEKITTGENLEQKLEPCIVSIMQKHFKEMYKTDIGEDGEFWNNVMILLTKNCSNFRKLASSPDNRPKIEEKSAILDCEDLKIGNYFYVNHLKTSMRVYCEDLKIGNYFYETNGKNYLAFTKNQVIENRGGGIYSISKIDWLDKCVYRLTLQETNSRFETLHMTEPYTFKIIENHKDYFIVQTQYYENGGFNNVKVYKLTYQGSDDPEK